MGIYTQTVKQFVTDSYQLISANSPNTGLKGDDMSKGVQFLNELLKSYSSSSLNLTISKHVIVNIVQGQSFLTFGDPGYTPTPYVTEGRLSNLQTAWLNLEGVTYPLIDEDRNVFFGSYKYEPQLGLPRFVILTNDNNLTTMQLYPGPSQGYELNIYGKFELSSVDENSTMVNIPLYYYRFLKMALARDLALYKGRSAVWDEKLESRYQEYLDDMQSASTINLSIQSANESYLNGSWRVKAGV